MKIAVTGGSGRIGRFVLRELLEHGHEPVNVDLAAPAGGSAGRRSPT